MIRVRQVKVNIENDTRDNLLSKVSKKIGISVNDIKSFKIVKKSVKREEEMIIGKQ